MTNDLVTKSSIAEILENLNLPQLVAGEAGKAFSRLVGEGLDIPSAWIERYTRSIRDGTEARSTVSKALAEAAANKVTTDPALVERATQALLAREIRKQENREAIAKKALDLLSEAPESAPQDDTQPKQTIDEDWLNMFGRYAEEASTERLRDLWARIMAGQIRKPGCFSLRTLRFIAELDLETARTFEEYADMVADEDYIPMPSQVRGKLLDALLLLQDAELITGVGADISRTSKSGLKLARMSFAQGHVVFFDLAKGRSLNIDCVLLTRVGREILGILTRKFDEKRVTDFVEQFDKTGIQRVTLGGYMKDKSGQEVRTTLRVLWEDVSATQGA